MGSTCYVLGRLARRLTQEPPSPAGMCGGTKSCGWTKVTGGQALGLSVGGHRVLGSIAPSNIRCPVQELCHMYPPVSAPGP
jgi:hypothetical protein